MNKERDYIDSFEENKNLLMALKKASDLGESFEIPLVDGSTVVIADTAAIHCVDVLMQVKSADRELFCQEMGKDRATFMAGLRLLLSKSTKR